MARIPWLRSQHTMKSLCRAVPCCVAQFTRMEVLDVFRSGKQHLLIATDVAARGLDIKSIKTVINYDAARDIDTHIHRQVCSNRDSNRACLAVSRAFGSALKVDAAHRGQACVAAAPALPNIPQPRARTSCAAWPFIFHPSVRCCCCCCCRVGRTGRAGDKEGVAYTLLLGRKDAHFAGLLVNSLSLGGQEVPRDLHELAMNVSMGPQVLLCESGTLYPF